MLIFVEGGKPEKPAENPRTKAEQQQTQATYGTDHQAEFLIGASSHCCTIPAPQTFMFGDDYSRTIMSNDFAYIL